MCVGVSTGSSLLVFHSPSVDPTPITFFPALKPSKTTNTTRRRPTGRMAPKVREQSPADSNTDEGSPVPSVAGPRSGSPPSPTTLALASLNMTRDDLARHTVQMRSFLNAQRTAAVPPFPIPTATQDAVKTVITNATTTVLEGRPSLEAVLERSEKRKKDKKQPSSAEQASSAPTAAAASTSSLIPPTFTERVYTLKPPPSRASVAVSNASRASSVSSVVPPAPVSILFEDWPFRSRRAETDPPRRPCSFQDVFTSRSGSTAPSASLDHPSLPRSASVASQMSSLANERDLDHEADIDALLGLNQASQSHRPHIHSLPDQDSPRHLYPPNTESSSPSASSVLVTPQKSSGQPKTQNQTMILPSATSPRKVPIVHPGLSPLYSYPSSSPITPYRPHGLKPPFPSITSSARPRNALPSSSPIPNSSPVSVVDMSPTSPATLPFKLPPGPRLVGKPHYSYAALIGQALMSSPTNRLSLNQIYQWISMAYPFFKRGEAGWQNSIRHNLSLNGCFVKIKRDDGEKGKGSWWAIREGDEGCFAGGGFVRQGRAGGRKRKGKAEKDTAEQEDAVNADPITDDDAGASPKKKKKTSAGAGKPTASSASTSHRPGNLPAYSRSASASTTATSIFSQATTSSYDSSASYSQSAYQVPSTYASLSTSQSSEGVSVWFHSWVLECRI